MTRDRIRDLLAAKPFTPFVIHTDDGDLIPVKSPEFIWIHPSGDAVFIALGSDESAETRIISLGHVSQMTAGPGQETRFPSSQG